MRFLGLLPVLALFAFSEAFVPGRTPSLLGIKKPLQHLNNVFPDFARLSQKNEVFPDFPKPSEKEWVEIIKATMEGKYPKYLMNSDTSLTLNETGCFENTNGDKGSWNLSSSLHLVPDQDGAHLWIETGQSFMVNGVHLAKGKVSVSSYTDLTRFKVVGIARAFSSALFVIKEGNVFELLETDEGFVAGSTEALDESSRIVGGVSTGLHNMTNDYSIRVTTEETIAAFGKERANVTGIIQDNLMPLLNFNSQNPMDQILKLVDLTSDPSGLGANYTGYFTLGDSGSYHFDQDASAMNLITGFTLNTTSVSNGNYASSGSLSKQELSAYQHGLVEIMTHRLF